MTAMDTSPVDEAFGRWRAAMLDSLASPERVLAWQDRRYRFAHRVGQLLAGDLGNSPASIAEIPQLV
jgi:hypothetical protein